MQKSLFFMLLFFALHTQAQINAPLKKVTVYPVGAVLEHAVKVDLKKGSQTIMLRGFAPESDPSSFLIEIDGYVSVMSHRFLRDYNTQKPIKKDSLNEEKIKKLEKIIGKLQRENAIMEVSISIENKALSIIMENEIEKRETVKEIEALAAYVRLYKEQAYLSQDKINNMRLKQNLNNDSITEISTKIEEIRNSTIEIPDPVTVKKTGYLELQLDANEAVASNITVSCFSQRASWNASYDIISEGIDKPLKIKYKANIYQTTGIDWNHVKVGVSTSQLNRSNTQPMLVAWYLNVYQTYHNDRKKSMSKDQDMQAEGEVFSGTRSMNSYIPSFDHNENKAPAPLMAYTGLSISFDAEGFYAIPADNSRHNVLLKTFDVNCAYKHYVVPKLDKDVFMLAELKEFEQYNFLPGEAQVFLEGKFTGKTFIDPFITTETLNFSLGRDNYVVVKRENTKMFEKNKLFEDNKTSYYKYVIKVKNNRDKEITIIIKDQYPLSANAKITVTEKEHSSGGELNEELGVVTWTETIGKGKTKEVSISYNITRPKDMILSGL